MILYPEYLMEDLVSQTGTARKSDPVALRFDFICHLFVIGRNKNLTMFVLQVGVVEEVVSFGSTHVLLSLCGRKGSGQTQHHNGECHSYEQSGI
jgi:hypothetical protein